MDETDVFSIYYLCNRVNMSTTIMLWSQVIDKLQVFLLI